MVKEYMGNLLDECSIYSYDLSLHFVNRILINEINRDIGKCLKPGNLVARNSEKADYVIQSLEQDFTFERSLSTIGAEYRMSIFEPNGTTLLPRIIEISNEQDAIVARESGRAPPADASVSTHVDGAYVITVGFKGRDRDNRPMRNLPVFHFPCTLGGSGFTFDVTSAGTQYDLRLKCLMQEEFDYLTASSQSEFTVRAATLGEFVEEFNMALRENMRAIWALDKGSIYLDDVTIELDPKTRDRQMGLMEIRAGRIQFECRR